ncbi:hypothetical protein [Aeromonas sanarellii]|uniref:hypothetical protein n=1 Tax=Aeromonas sanarellii TaxID=633415 RepID=UPI001C21DDF9|nr:hypothetical protein I6L39_03680 [Aeromonas sp. FDAARGOS 1409]
MTPWRRWRVPLLFAAVILLPVLLAALTLRQGWYEPGTRSKGVWMHQEIYLLPPLPSSQSQWRLVYLVARPCEGLCRQVPELMARIQSALGRNLDKLALVQLPSQRGASDEVRAGDMLLVDAQGLAILRYRVPASTAQWPLFGKAVLSDLQQLLKYQRGVQ